MDSNGDGFISIEEIKSMFYDVCLEDDILTNKEGMTLQELKDFMLEITNKKTNL